MPRFCGSRFWHYYRRRRRLRRRLFRVTFGRLLRAAVERKGVTKRKVSRALFNTHWFKVLKFRVTIGERGGGEPPSVRNHITDQQRSFAKRLLLLLLEREREKERESSSFSLLLLWWWFESARKKDDGKRERERERGASCLSSNNHPNGIFSSLFWCASANRASFLSLSLSRARERGR